MKEKNFGLDLVRALAIILVVLVHSFMHSGFNATSLNGIKMFILLFVRSFGHCGVLLFLLLTGYLKNKKKVNSKHYNGIKKVLITYVVISIITLFYRMFIRNDNSSLLSLITGIFSFQTAPYSWYVEMYIGLFFLIPFLNILYNNIKTKNEKNILIITLFLFSSFFPTICAIKIAGHSFDLLPNYWALLYPILMYYIGCFISEYQIKINKYIMFFVIMVTAFLSTFLLYFYAQNATVNSLGITEHYLFSVILSILIFLFFYDFKCNSRFITKIVRFFANVSFGTYLISFCFDDYIYKYTLFLKDNPYYFFICTFIFTPIIFILSSISSYFVSVFIIFFQKKDN